MTPERENDIIAAAVELAAAWQNRANELLTHEEKGIQEQMKRLLSHPLDKVVLTKLIDQSFRSHDPERVADQVNSLLKHYGVPDFFTHVERLLMQMFLGLGRHFPALAVPSMIKRMRQSSSRAIIPGEHEPLHAHLQKRQAQGVRMNINHLGEAVLGEQEAKKRLDTYIRDMADPHIEYISVKISTIYSQISSLAFEHTVGVLKERLSELYRAARQHVFERNDGTRIPKFVNLDMEEYRDLEITYQTFIRTLSEPEFRDLSAGIVLQAYLPDSFEIQKQMTAWAQQRVDAGGAPIKLRIVKGANMEMEKLESALFDWPLAPYDNKLDVDANYKRMVVFGMQPDNIRAVNLGIASHNLFDLAYAAEMGKALGVRDYFYFEMLEGMADHVRRALCEISGDVLLYAPVASQAEFINAIAYLIRRLDENTAPENFLHHAPSLKVNSAEWKQLQEQFVKACAHREKASATPHRIQDRTQERFADTIGSAYTHEFVNEPNTDWSLAANRGWAEDIRNKWMKAPQDDPIRIPLVVDGETIFDDRPLRACMDPSQYHAKVCVAKPAMASEADIQRAVAAAKGDADGWHRLSQDERHQMLSRVAIELRRARADLIGAAAAGTGKVFTETDVEVSEAVDFAEFYPFSAHTFDRLETVRARGRGVGAVISPWNFPVAIPCGGIVAALAAGNTVVFKPASEALLPAWVLCQCFWRAGVSKRVLQFVPCSGAQVGPSLTNHPDVDFVILTGGTETGLHILASRPGIYLAAETGGKNATIVTDMADRDQAIKNIIYSAFGNTGQKCSATSLLLLERSIYEDPHFEAQLVDAARSLPVGSAWDFQNKIGPLVHPPAGNLKQALTTLLPGERFALKPRNLDDNPCLWTPGIKYGVKPGTDTHMIEFFGPLLGVIPFDTLEQAITLVNQTGYGLTSGLESLDRREQLLWQKGIKAGNLYINRGTTGAITLRQPFGGMGKSALGAGIKAGSPDYVAQFMHFEEHGLPPVDTLGHEDPILAMVQRWRQKIRWHQVDPVYCEDLERTARAALSYLYHMERLFARENDYFHLRGQDNILRYLPVDKMLIRVHPQDTLFEVLARLVAACIAGNTPLLSLPKGIESPVHRFLDTHEGRELLDSTRILTQDEAEVGAMLPRIERIRYAAPERVSAEVLAAAAKNGFYLARAPVMMEGRLEMLHYLRQQSICNNYHRYGNLGDRALVREDR